jgi:putative AbiEii toxin of type IV toxin-antitoxin system
MYGTFEARHFRALRQTRLSDLARFNLITGLNNVGKTALIEAMFVHAGGFSPQLILQLNGFRGLQALSVEFGPHTESPWDSLFTDFDTSTPVNLTGLFHPVGKIDVRLELVKDPDELQRISTPIELDLTDSAAASAAEAIKVLALTYSDDRVTDKTFYQIVTQRGIQVQPPLFTPRFPTWYVSAAPPRGGEEAQRFSKLQVEGSDHYVLEALQVIEPRLTRLLVIIIGDTPVLHGDIGTRRLMPLALMGNGMTRVAQIATFMANVPGGLLLVDEVENGLHYSALTNVWRALTQAAKALDVQLVATTHSRECIIAAHNAIGKELMESEFRLYRLDRDGDGVAAKSYDYTTVMAALESGLEIR